MTFVRPELLVLLALAPRVAARAALPPRDDRATPPSSSELEGVPRPAPPVEWASACVLLALLALLAEAAVFHRRGLP